MRLRSLRSPRSGSIWRRRSPLSAARRSSSPTAPEKETVEADPPQEAAGPGVAAPEPEKPLSEQLVREGLVPQTDAAAEAVRTEEARPDAQNARTVPSEPGERGEEAGRSVEAAVLSAGTSAPYAADAEQSATEGSRPEATAPNAGSRCSTVFSIWTIWWTDGGKTAG